LEFIRTLICYGKTTLIKTLWHNEDKGNSPHFLPPASIVGAHLSLKMETQMINFDYLDSEEEDSMHDRGEPIAYLIWNDTEFPIYEGDNVIDVFNVSLMFLFGHKNIFALKLHKVCRKESEAMRHHSRPFVSIRNACKYTM
jgi:hypothetical protein